VSSTKIAKSMRAIVACLLFGIGFITFNIGLFFWVQIAGVRSNLGLIEYVNQTYQETPSIYHTLIGLEIAVVLFWPALFIYFVYKHDPSLMKLVKQMIVGWAVLVTFIMIIAGMILLALFHDGKLGKLSAFALSLLCTPFTMEFLLCIIGASLVICLNTIRLKLTGDEYVEMEIQE